MSDIIHILPSHVANQIAAGEVIQRPASVVKELLENAVDAGATQIDLWVEQAGKASIRVVDNGKGMSPKDAELAFKRHATSKIMTADDLFNLKTFGFRGEALASIAAVAQVTLQTRREEDEVGVSVYIEGSTFGERRLVASPVGSNFMVRNLFFNVPARRRFLKSDQTELNNIMAEFERVALIHPDIAFTLHRDNNLIIDLRAGSQRKRIVDVFGQNLDQHLVPFEAETPIVRLSGFIGTPQSARVKGLRQFFFVNGRYMKHPYFHRAILQAYDRLIPPDKQVHYFCMLDVEPRNIDVNIHPTKTEVKFEDDRAIWQIILASARSALAKADAVPSIDFDKGDVPEIPTLNLTSVPVQPRLNLDPTYNPFDSSPRISSPSTDDSWAELYRHLAINEQRTKESELLPAENEPKEQVGEAGNAYLQVGGRYIVTAVKSGMMVIDQHRASVRVLYDRFLRELSEHNGVTQSLLFPDLMQLPVTQTATFLKYIDHFRSVGFDITDDGGGNFAIKGVPVGIGSADATVVLGELFDDLMSHVPSSEDKLFHRIALSLSRQSAIVYGQSLSSTEMAGLVDGLFESASPNFDPAGKTILVIVSGDKLDSYFK